MGPVGASSSVKALWVLSRELIWSSVRGLLDVDWIVGIKEERQHF